MHPQDEVMSPQGVMALFVVHSSHSAAQNRGSTPTIVPIHQISSPHPAEPKEWDPSSLPCSPSGLFTSVYGYNTLYWLGISWIETPITLRCYRSVHNILHRALEPFPRQENAPRVHN
jgi:hypothetical protein